MPKKGYKGRDRRKHPRREASIEIIYSSLETFFYDYSVNISRGGMFVKTGNPLHVGSKINLRFLLPGSERIIESRGRVMHTVSGKSRKDEPHGMGIQFEDLTKEDRDLIDSLLEKSMREGAGR